MTKTMPELVVMCGIPGSGKSTYVQDHFDYVVNPDAIRQELGVQFDPKLEPQVWDLAYTKLRTGLSMGLKVCFDATSVSKKRRQPLIDIAREFGAEAIGIYMATPFPECARRNALRPNPVPISVLDRMHSQLEEPSVVEGFYDVVVIVNY